MLTWNESQKRFTGTLYPPITCTLIIGERDGLEKGQICYLRIYLNDIIIIRIIFYWEQTKDLKNWLEIYQN